MEDNNSEPNHPPPDFIKESPPWETTRMPWKDVRQQTESNKVEPKANQSENINGYFILKKFWFPLLLLPLTAIIVLRFDAQTKQLEQNQAQLRNQLNLVPTPIQSPTTNWNNFISTSINVQFKYPDEFIVEEKDNSIRIYSKPLVCREKGSNNEFENTSEISIDIFLHKNKDFNQSWLEAFNFEFDEENVEGSELIDGNKAYYFFQGSEISFGKKSYLVEMGPQKSLEINIYTPSYTFECQDYLKEFSNDPKYSKLATQILSTFKFIEQTPISTLPQSKNKYQPTSSWKLNQIITLDVKDENNQTVDSQTLRVCLPPNWDFDPSSKGNIKYYRDPGYTPDATSIHTYQYTGGSRRQEYLDMKLKWEPELQSKVTVKELTINGKPFLRLNIPSFPDVLLTVINGHMTTINIEYKPLVNDSEEAFFEDIFTIASCITTL